MFKEKIWLSSPTMHGNELKYMEEAFKTNWMSTVGANIDEIEKQIADKVGVSHAVALSAGTAALHLAVRFAGEKIYGKTVQSKGSLAGHRVFCSDMTFAATVNPIVYECGVPVFIDTEYDTWNMNPEALERAFRIYPDVKLVVVAHLYGVPAKIDEIREICKRHGAYIVEDAAESLGATYRGIQTGSLGDFNAISFNGNKIITGSSGGMLLTDSEEAAAKIKKWSTQSREVAPWYQHEELGYNYRMSNVVAGVVRGQLPYLEEHISQKKTIYERYRDGLKDLPISMNPFDEEKSTSNYWLSCMIIDESAMAVQKRGPFKAYYEKEKGKTCPTEILERLMAENAEGRPIWKPMHMQPEYSDNGFVSVSEGISVGEDIFNRGLCLPSDNKMLEKDQEEIIKIIRACFE